MDIRHLEKIGKLFEKEIPFRYTYCWIKRFESSQKGTIEKCFIGMKSNNFAWSILVPDYYFKTSTYGFQGEELDRKEIIFILNSIVKNYKFNKLSRPLEETLILRNGGLVPSHKEIIDYFEDSYIIENKCIKIMEADYIRESVSCFEVEVCVYFEECYQDVWIRVPKEKCLLERKFEHLLGRKIVFEKVIDNIKQFDWSEMWNS